MAGKLTREERAALSTAVALLLTSDDSPRRQRALRRGWAKVLEWHRPKDFEKVTWTMEFLVTVEAFALDEIDAIAIATEAAQWPGDWHPRFYDGHNRVVKGELNGQTVEATLCRSRCIAITRKDRNAPQD